MPDKLEKCVMKLMKDPSFKPKDGKDKRSSAFAVCTAMMKKSKEEFNDWLGNSSTIAENVKIEYSVPIEEVISTEKKLLNSPEKPLRIKGEAIRETISANGIEYVAEELEKSYSTLKETPILDTHNSDSILSVMGTVKEVEYNSDDKIVNFEADIMDSGAKERIKDGRISKVSVGAVVEKLIRKVRVVKDAQGEEEAKTSFVAQGIKFMELSLVAFPGVATASITQAISEAFKQEASGVVEYNDQKEGFDMENGITIEDVKTLLEPITSKISAIESSVSRQFGDVTENLSKKFDLKLERKDFLTKLREMAEDGAEVPDEEELEEETNESLKAMINVIEKNFKKKEVNKEKTPQVGSLPSGKPKEENENLIIEGKDVDGIAYITGSVDSKGEFLLYKKMVSQ